MALGARLARRRAPAQGTEREELAYNLKQLLTPFIARLCYAELTV